MGDIGVPELLIILAIVLILFGPGRLMGLGAGLGHAIRAFRQSVRDDEPTVTAPPTPPEPIADQSSDAPSV